MIANSGTALTERQISLVWKFFSNPIVCLDGDESGQKAALRIAEKLFPLINEKNKIYFSIMPDGTDPDDYIKNNGLENFNNLDVKFLSIGNDVPANAAEPKGHSFNLLIQSANLDLSLPVIST